MKKQQLWSWRSQRDAIKDRATKTISVKVLRLQRKWADWMNVKCNALSAGQRKIYFLLFFAVMGSFSALSLISAFREDSRQVVKSVVLERRSGIPKLQSPNKDDELSDAQLGLKIKEFDRYLDSLGQSASGREQTKKFLDSHPGLMDSVRRIKEMYKIK